MFTWALVALTASVAEAVPVPLAGDISFTVATECSPWCGGAEAKADVLGVEGKLANGQFQGGGGAATSAILGGGGFLGKTAAATASFEWTARVEAAPGADPLHLFFGWNATLFASHDALLGQATGGIEFDVTLYRCLSVYPLPGCFPFPTFERQVVYNDPIATGEQWDLGLFDRSGPYELLQVTFDVGSAAATTPWIGIYAEAFDIGTFDFSLRADNGLAPPPVPEPSTFAMALAGLITVFGLSRRRLAWA